MLKRLNPLRFSKRQDVSKVIYGKARARTFPVSKMTDSKGGRGIALSQDFID